MKKFFLLLYNDGSPELNNTIQSLHFDGQEQTARVFTCEASDGSCPIPKSKFNVSSEPTLLFLYEARPNLYIEADRIEGNFSRAEVLAKLSELQSFEAGEVVGDGTTGEDTGGDNGGGGVLPGFGNLLISIPWWLWLIAATVTYNTFKK
jgi:hypothetical protein